jgi:hypothetical protein
MVGAARFELATSCSQNKLQIDLMFYLTPYISKQSNMAATFHRFEVSLYNWQDCYDFTWLLARIGKVEELNGK